MTIIIVKMTASQQSFELIYEKEVNQHLTSIERKYHFLIRQAIEAQLKYEPNIQTRNRKPLARSSVFGENTWEIRFGPNNRFRVFYRMDLTQYIVRILAIGIKQKNQLWIGGERFDL